MKGMGLKSPRAKQQALPTYAQQPAYPAGAYAAGALNHSLLKYKHLMEQILQ
jgi:hypothetical protein